MLKIVSVPIENETENYRLIEANPSKEVSQTVSYGERFKDFITVFFEIKTKGSSIQAECLAGITVYILSTYIFREVPQILESSVFNVHGAWTSLCLCSGLGSIAIGLISNVPMVVGPRIALVTSYQTLLLDIYGFTWDEVIVLSLVSSGILFVIFIFFAKSALVSIPDQVRIGTTIGTTICFAIHELDYAGLTDSNKKNNNIEDLPLFITCLFLCAIFLNFNKSISIIAAMVITCSAYIITRAIKNDLTMNWRFPDSPSIPNYSWSIFGDISKVICFIGYMVISKMIYVICIVVSTVQFAYPSNEEYNSEQFREVVGSWEKAHRILVTESIVSLVSSSLGLPIFNCFTESCVGAWLGGKTGLVSVVTGICFLLSIFARPVLELIPSQVHGAFKIISCFIIFKLSRHIDCDKSEGIAAMICILCLASKMDIALGPCLGLTLLIVLIIAKRDWKSLTIPIFFFGFISFILFVIILYRDCFDW